MDTEPILFNKDMRKTFVEGVLQDIKGYFENKTNGTVAISYEDYKLKNYEFGFKLIAKKICTKQIWSETTSAIVNVINYILPSNVENDDGNSSFDISFCIEDDKLEVEVVSCW